MVSSLEWCPSRALRFKTLICQREMSFLAFSDAITHKLSLFFCLLVFSGATAANSSVMTSVPVHLSWGGPGPFSRVVPPSKGEVISYKTARIPLWVCVWCFTHLSVLAYECCRVNSKSFSRFLLCSRLQASSSPPRVSSSPSSSSPFWVVVGCGQQPWRINCNFVTSVQKRYPPPFVFAWGRFRSLTRGLAVSELGVSWLRWWASPQLSATSTPFGWSEGQRSSSSFFLYVSKSLAGGNKNSPLFLLEGDL